MGLCTVELCKIMQIEVSTVPARQADECKIEHATTVRRLMVHLLCICMKLINHQVNQSINQSNQPVTDSCPPCANCAHHIHIIVKINSRRCGQVSFVAFINQSIKLINETYQAFYKWTPNATRVLVHDDARRSYTIDVARFHCLLINQSINQSINKPLKI